ncbi:PRC-barrel domain-containing protein [Bradyrhizobium monzae]|uniref:PRC-barrel domain-containing protein n=1 Tax=Bradyrhizobium sp. Oc8 TaxID=2876780 RepID=UPI001F35EAB2|nr:PRC-barrel domain-containing protein [Bradyrhizobium sp. Oc8]
MPRAKAYAATILREYHKAETELIGKAVVLTDGKAGTVEGIYLDEAHGLRLTVAGHPGKWPISTIKLAQK